MNTSNNVNSVGDWQSENQGTHHSNQGWNGEENLLNTSENIKDEQGSGLFNRAINNLKGFANLSSMLRIFGAIAMLVSMSMFLMQGWGESSDFHRFGMMILQTVLLSIGGFAMIKLLKEKKGARLLFGLALVSVTANFTTIGALVYSVLPLDSLSVNYPSFALWQVDSPLTAFASIAIGLLFLIPLSFLAFSMLVRPAAKQLTLWYAAANLLLVIPVRETAIIMVILGVAGFALMQLFLSKKNQLVDSSLFTWKTQEGRYARLILIAPLLVMLARSSFYEFGVIADLILAISLYIFASTLPKMVEYKIAILGYLVAFISAIYIAFMIVMPSFGWFSYVNPFSVPVFSLILTVLSVDLYFRSQGTWAQTFVKIAGTLIVGLVLTVNYLDYAFAFSTLSLIAMTTVCAYLGFKTRDYFLLAVSAVLAIILILMNIGEMVDLFIGSGWIGFAICGAIVITLASLMDRYGAILKMKLISK